MIQTDIISVIIINGNQFLHFLPFLKAYISITNKIRYIIAKHIVNPIFILSRKPMLINFFFLHVQHNVSYTTTAHVARSAVV